MRSNPDPHLDTTVLDANAVLAIAMRGYRPDRSLGLAPSKTGVPAPVGLWLSADGAVRLDIRTDGTYAGSVAGRRRGARGTYRIDGTSMTLWDDSGLRTPVTVRDGMLEMAGHRLEPA